MCHQQGVPPHSKTFINSPNNSLYGSLLLTSLYCENWPFIPVVCSVFFNQFLIRKRPVLPWLLFSQSDLVKNLLEIYRLHRHFLLNYCIILHALFYIALKRELSCTPDKYDWLSMELFKINTLGELVYSFPFLWIAASIGYYPELFGDGMNDGIARKQFSWMRQF